MSRCDICHEEPARTNSCLAIPVVIGGRALRPIPFGKEAWRLGFPRCPDCRVERSGLHHAGCRFESCPACNRQLVSCGCIDDAEAQVRVLGH